MNKVKSLDDLRRLKQSLEGAISVRRKGNELDELTVIRIGMATCGIASGARGVLTALVEVIDKQKIPAALTQCGCLGHCHAEPILEITKPGGQPVVIGNVDAQAAAQIVEKYILNGQPLEESLPLRCLLINPSNKPVWQTVK